MEMQSLFSYIHINQQILIVIQQIIFQYMITPNQKFKVDDLNHLIKLYAYEIQQRFQEMSKINTFYSHTDGDESEDVGQTIRNKYKDYSTSNPIEVKYLEKFVQRIIQIFSFFKSRCKHQALLNSFEEKINIRFDTILAKRPVDMGELVNYILSMTKAGFFHKSTNITERKRIFIRIPSKQSQFAINQMPRPRRTVSVVTNANNNKSLVNNQAHTPSKPVLPKQTNQELFNKLYPMLGLDKNHFIKSIDNSTNVRRQLMQKNESNLNALKQYQKQHKKTYEYTDNKNILKDSNQVILNKKAPVINNWINRKRRIATAYKNRQNENNWCF